jgi:hypothetical protein
MGAAVLALAGAALVPLSAHAEDNGPTGVPGKSCPIVNSDGTVEQVPVGTHAGILYCGQDGNWHIGWLVDGRQFQQPTHPILGAAAGGVVFTTPTSASNAR